MQPECTLLQNLKTDFVEFAGRDVEIGQKWQGKN